MKKFDNLWSFNTRDLMRASSCTHCMKLAVARELDQPGVRDLVAEFTKPVEGLPVVYGEKFEAAIEAELLESLGPNAFQRPLGADAVQSTIDLMRAKVPVIYQGSMKHRIDEVEFSGRPDFLVRGDYQLEFVDGKISARPKRADEFIAEKSDSFYTAFDAKLAGVAKPHYLLQVGLYVDALAELGLKSAELHGLILGSRQLALFEESEILPAMQLARAALFSAIAEAETIELDSKNLFCESADACSVCEYPELCTKARIEVDHLSQVAGINKSQIAKLGKNGITTMRELAETSARPAEIPAETFEKLQSQAALQHGYKVSGKHSFALLPDPEIKVLPPSSANDIFFDIEGFPFFEQKGGLEYLWGATTRDGKFHHWWAHNREQEKLAFEGFVSWAVATLKAHPEAHIYHYAQYEVTALNRMVDRHDTMGEDVAWLFAENKLVDLYKTVRGSIQISQPSYSIKKLEVFYELNRDSDVVDAMGSVESYDLYRQLAAADDPAAAAELASIASYNEADCISTQKLYDWLAELPGACSGYENHQLVLDRKKQLRASQSEEDGAGNKAEIELAALKEATDSIASTLDNWPWGQNEVADYRAKIWETLVHCILFYKREEVMYWRDLRIKRQAPNETLHKDRSALVVVGSETFDQSADGKKIHYRYFLEQGQANFFEEKDSIYVRFDYGANQQDLDRGTITFVSDDYIEFVRTVQDSSENFAPNAIFDATRIPAGAKQDVIREFAQTLAAEWGSPTKEPPKNRAVFDLLMRREPRLSQGSLAAVDGEDYLTAVIDSALRLDKSVLAIQGPPGTGKTYLGSRTIAELVAQGKKIGVVANSHSAVENLLYGCLDAGVTAERIAKMKPKIADAKQIWFKPAKYGELVNWLDQQIDGFVLGGTAWAFCNPVVNVRHFDYLFIDEAAQFSLVDAIAVSSVADNLVLLGDPMQLTQVVQAVHPGGVDNSALGHYMGDHEILPSSMGYFIEVTRRMHPAVNAPVSKLAYQNRLHSHESAIRELPGLSAGFKAIAVEHHGNSTYSREEISVVLQLVQDHIKITEQSEILVVAPYNAQVDLIRKALDLQGFFDVQVGTVDKFQGREGNVVIVSLAASSASDAPRGLEFLLDRNRLNVALSRAKTNSYLIYSPNLLRTKFSKVEDVLCVSRLAGLVAGG